jgi:hypothetical protein
VPKPELKPDSELAEHRWYDINSLPDEKEIAHHGWAKHVIAEIQNKMKN